MKKNAQRVLEKKVLDFVKEKYKGQRIFLNIEEPNENSKNNSQRLKRKSFYENNVCIKFKSKF